MNESECECKKEMNQVCDACQGINKPHCENCGRVVDISFAEDEDVVCSEICHNALMERVQLQSENQSLKEEVERLKEYETWANEKFAEICKAFWTDSTVEVSAYSTKEDKTYADILVRRLKYNKIKNQKALDAVKILESEFYNTSWQLSALKTIKEALVSTWEIYRMAKVKSQKEIKNLLETTETLNQIRDNLQDENRKLEQELQKTREQLNTCEKLLMRFVPDEKTIQWQQRELDARQYFKDKQGE